MDTPRTSETITLHELAAILGIGLTKAYELAQTNRLPVPVIRVGREYRFSRRAVERLLDSQHDHQEN